MTTGGPAFPTTQRNLTILSGDPKNWKQDDISAQSGMTLLDWFAGQALMGLLANPTNTNCNLEQKAYNHAELMLVEKTRRKKR